jgi:ADP-heptose:LPS heptosyltransferase
MLFLKYDSSYRIEIPFLKISNHKNDQTNENQKNTIAIAPGSGSPRKNWPFKNYLQTAELLKLKGFKIIWIIGPADQQLKLPKVDIVFNNKELLLVTKLLSNCTGFIGNDSGITHLSAAVGCPTTALFGASDPTVWGPRGKNVNILFKKQNCSPCHPSRKNNNQCNSLCLKSITVNEVINSTLNIIKKSKKLL